ncbi:hypothetical protein CDCA_CDCA02G0799 [Cyanidium caldarium]|uniref:Uncharacterized protein n=1 Tax=Cyanidium caldarium TaxID=2771 RepID=A0AAV9IR91_CYACA|nr:hypothetical protein CDCA_CDCA02G0799 [Cyanidium caldarium]
MLSACSSFHRRRLCDCLQRSLYHCRIHWLALPVISVHIQPLPSLHFPAPRPIVRDACLVGGWRRRVAAIRARPIAAGAAQAFEKPSSTGRCLLFAPTPNNAPRSHTGQREYWCGCGARSTSRSLSRVRRDSGSGVLHGRSLHRLSGNRGLHGTSHDSMDAASAKSVGADDGESSAALAAEGTAPEGTSATPPTGAAGSPTAPTDREGATPTESAPGRRPTKRASVRDTDTRASPAKVPRKRGRPRKEELMARQAQAAAAGATSSSSSPAAAATGPAENAGATAPPKTMRWRTSAAAMRLPRTVHILYELPESKPKRPTTVPPNRDTAGDAGAAAASGASSAPSASASASTSSSAAAVDGKRDGDRSKQAPK